MIAILIKSFIGNINGYKNIKKIIWLCMLIPVFGIAKEKPTVVYTPLELLEMTVTNKIPNSGPPFWISLIALKCYLMNVNQ